MTGRSPLGPDRPVYLVVDPVACGARGVAATVAAALPCGVGAVQLRWPDADDGDLVRLGRELAGLLAGSGVPLLLNDRPDLVAAAGADGSHVGQGDLPPADARALLGPRRLLGLSVRTVSEAVAASALPPGLVDYLGTGPVWPTASKPDAAAPLGLPGLRDVVDRTSLPVVAIGGIDADRARLVAPTGAVGAAVISAVCSAADPAAATRALARAWRAAVGEPAARREAAR